MRYADMSRERLVEELEELRRRIAAMEKLEVDSRQTGGLSGSGPLADGNRKINVAGIDVEWQPREGTCTFATLPVAMMWVDTTLMGLMSGLQAMVGVERFGLALQSEGRRSVEADWEVISRFPDFKEGFRSIANIAAVAGWGEWKLIDIDESEKRCRFRAWNSWEGRYQKARGVCWGSGMLAGKMAGYCSNLFETNCWADQTSYIARGDAFDEFLVTPSERSVEKEIENLLATDEATRADMAVALQKLKKEIAERGQTEQERIRLTTAIEQAAEVVIITDLEGRMQYVNPAFEQITGYGRLEAVDRSIDILESGVHDETFYRRMWDTISGGEVWNGHFVNKRKDQTLFEMEATISPVRDESGAIINYVSVQRDVTQEEALKAQLQQAQKMEAVGTLAGGIAHDFNNILQAIQGYAELLLIEKKGGQAGYQELSEINRAARRGSELTQQLLAFSRKIDSNLQPVDINAEVTRAKKLLEHTIPKMIEIELDLTPDLRAVRADAAQVEQVLVNLGVNAKDAMPEGGRLTITTENVLFDETYCLTKPEAKPGAYVRIIVADTGSGIDEEIIEHIFEPFFTTKGLAKGTGLGLSMVYGIIKNHGGHIECFSKLGAGTKFVIDLPVIDQAVESTKGTEAGFPAGGNETLLLVDDEEFIRELGRQMLTRFGYTVLTAANGESALEIYKKEHQQLELYREVQSRIDLVILDLIMPGIGGRKCLKELLRVNPQLRVLVSSGYSEVGPMRETLEAGAVGFVSKPYDVRRLLHEVRGALDRDR